MPRVAQSRPASGLASGPGLLLRVGGASNAAEFADAYRRTQRRETARDAADRARAAGLAGALGMTGS